MPFPLPALGLVALLASPAAAVPPDDFADRVAPVLEQHCLRCHSGPAPRAGLSLATAPGLRKGGDSGPAVVPGQPDASLLLKQLTGPKPNMPRGGPPLPPEQVAALRAWIQAGAPWPDGLTLRNRHRPAAESVWWSLRPLARPPMPAVRAAAKVRTPVDAFLLARLEAEGLTFSPEADRRTLLRRLSFDLLGLPPTPEEVEAFVRDDRPDAYERLVDRLLASPHYGERWGRHWLDVARYGDTHGYDKDKVRPHAWPYRDWVIRALNDDKPYARFVREQLAGDVLAPGMRDGVTAVGFLAAGPWDFVGQVELREGTLDKAITRNLDRDDMVTATLNAFCSLTVQCARCHDHKFDPVTQDDYYALQAVFAAVDRADRPYEPDETVVRRRRDLIHRREELTRRQQTLEDEVRRRAGPELGDVERQLTAANQAKKGARPEFGYHSAIETRPDVPKWVQVDLRRPVPVDAIVLVGCHDTFNNIGAGFGFPVRYKVEVADDPEFKSAVLVRDETRADVPNPGVRPQVFSGVGKMARYVRVTATRLAPRQNDWIFALAELQVLTRDGTNAAAGATVAALDSIEAPVRWGKKNLTDGTWYGQGTGAGPAEVARLEERRRALRDKALDDRLRRELADTAAAQKETAAALAALPPPGLVYAAATDFAPSGSFTPTGGKPRPVHLLARGSEKSPRREVAPGAVAGVGGPSARFPLPPDHAEGQRRTALADWITDASHPLTWRSAVNRAWHYHFGKGLVDTPNDFGRMGSPPSHPELLDWLAVEFRDSGGSLKSLHRLLVTSTAYRQASAHDEAAAARDSGNRLLWRTNRRRLEAEAVRDAVLAVAGRLDRRQGGPAFRAFGFQDDHSPHYKYDEHDPDDPAAGRRSVYRFLVRSVPDPFLETLDCADPSQSVDRRNETLTALQALSLLNNKFMVRMAAHLATRAEAAGSGLPERVSVAFRLALGRVPAPDERDLLLDHARRHGLAGACRLLLNTNEFSFVD